MKSQKTVALSLLLAFVVVSKAQATTIQFNTPGFAEAANGMQSFTKNGVDIGGGVLVNMTFDALSLSGGLTPSRFLYWDANDGNGYADGFGIMREAGAPLSNDSYANDEIEADEILRLSFSTPLNLLGFNVTDFFEEREGGDFGDQLLADCDTADPDNSTCYVERGFYSINGGAWVDFLAAFGQFRTTSNGVQDIDVNAFNVSSIMFRAPGRSGTIANKDFRLEDYSLAGIRVEPSTVPDQSSSLMLMSTGLLAIIGAMRRRKAQLSNPSAPEV